MTSDHIDTGLFDNQSINLTSDRADIFFTNIHTDDTISFPVTIEIGTENLTLVDPSTNPTNMPSEGHYHILLDDLFSTYEISGHTTPTIVNFSGITPGIHLLTAYWYNNDDTIAMPLVVEYIPIIVQ